MPEQLNAVLDHCRDVLHRIAGTDSQYLTLHLVELLVQYESGEFKEYAEIIDKTALAAAADADQSRARAY